MRIHWNRAVAVTALAGIVWLATAVPAVAAPRPDNLILKGSGGGHSAETREDPATTLTAQVVSSPQESSQPEADTRITARN